MKQLLIGLFLMLGTFSVFAAEFNSEVCMTKWEASKIGSYLSFYCGDAKKPVKSVKRSKVKELEEFIAANGYQKLSRHYFVGERARVELYVHESSALAGAAKTCLVLVEKDRAIWGKGAVESYEVDCGFGGTMVFKAPAIGVMYKYFLGEELERVSDLGLKRWFSNDKISYREFQVYQAN